MITFLLGTAAGIGLMLIPKVYNIVKGWFTKTTADDEQGGN